MATVSEGCEWFTASDSKATGKTRVSESDCWYLASSSKASTSKATSTASAEGDSSSTLSAENFAWGGSIGGYPEVSE